MKEIEVETVVDDCTAQLYFDAVYSGDACMREYHARVNKDPAATVEAWGPDGVRAVRFVMPINVPAMLKSCIGMDNVPVVETQRVEWQSDRTGFKMVSEPLLNIPGANKFTTSGSLTASNKPDGSCQLKALMRCAASLPWPMQATVEGVMATEASASINAFLSFCKEFYKRWRAEQQLQPERPAGPSPPQPTATAASAADEFFDAVEDEAELRRIASTTGAAGAATATAEVVSYIPPRLEDVIVDCLRQIQASSSETSRTLRAMEELLRNMDDNIQVLRDKLVGRRPPGHTAGASSSAAAAAAAGAPPPVPYGSRYLPLLAVTSLVCSVGTLVYVRLHHPGVGSVAGGK